MRLPRFSGYAALLGLFTLSCVLGFKFSRDITLEHATQITNNPFAQLMRALDTFDMVAHFHLRSGTYELSDIPNVGSVSLTIPQDMILSSNAHVQFLKEYQRDESTGRKILTRLTSKLASASITTSDPIQLKASLLIGQLHNITYDGKTVTAEVGLGLDVFNTFSAPATGRPVSDKNKAEIDRFVKKVVIDKIEGNFTSKEELYLPSFEGRLSEGSRIAIENGIIEGSENISADFALQLTFAEFLLKGNASTIRGTSNSGLVVNKLRFAYKNGQFSISGNENPLAFVFGGNFVSADTNLEIAAGSNLTFTSIQAKPSADTYGASISTSWVLASGETKLGSTTLDLTGSRIEMASAKLTSSPVASGLVIDDLAFVARVKKKDFNSDELAAATNARIASSIRAPLKRLTVNKLYEPATNYEFRLKKLELANFSTVKRANVEGVIGLQPGTLADFSVETESGIQFESRASLDALQVPFKFAIAAEKSTWDLSAGFDVAGTLSILNEVKFYEDNLAKYVSGVPGPLQSLVQVPLRLFLRPSTLTFRASARIARENDNFNIGFKTLSFGGNLATLIEAPPFGANAIDIGYGSEGTMPVRVTKDLPFGQKLEYSNNARVPGGTMTGPFAALQKIIVPLPNFM